MRRSRHRVVEAIRVAFMAAAVELASGPGTTFAGTRAEFATRFGIDSDFGRNESYGPALTVAALRVFRASNITGVSISRRALVRLVATMTIMGFDMPPAGSAAHEHARHMEKERDETIFADPPAGAHADADGTADAEDELDEVNPDAVHAE